MFNNSEKILGLNKKIETLEFANAKAQEIIYDKEQEIKDMESKLRIREQEIKMEISKATEANDKEIANLKQTVAVTQKENEILKKAFDNMGFDVKDMRGILDKLVEGIVGKNVVNVIK